MKWMIIAIIGMIILSGIAFAQVKAKEKWKSDLAKVIEADSVENLVEYGDGIRMANITKNGTKMIVITTKYLMGK